jgi:hypothetical protein
MYFKYVLLVWFIFCAAAAAADGKARNSVRAISVLVDSVLAAGCLLWL